MTELSPESQVRFWAKVIKSEQPNGCWIWTASRTKFGYGRHSCKDHNEYAHRLSWEMVHGPIPDGLKVLHECDVPSCVNPAHLFLGTLQDNMEDKVRKGRQPWGEHAGGRWRKLTEQEVREIREACARGEKQRVIAARYGIHDRHVGRIHRRVTWAHLDEAA